MTKLSVPLTKLILRLVLGSHATVSAMQQFQPCNSKIQLLIIYMMIFNQFLQNNPSFLLISLNELNASSSMRLSSSVALL